MSEETKEEEKKEEEKKKITVSKDKLDAILQNSETLQKTVAEQQKTIDMLMATADKSRLANYQERNGRPITHVYRVRIFKGKVVIGWKMVEDVMEKDANGRWIERQTVEIYTEDGKSYQLPYLQSEKIPKVDALFKGRKVQIDESGNEQVTLTLTLKEENRDIDISPVYVN